MLGSFFSPFGDAPGVGEPDVRDGVRLLEALGAIASSGRGTEPTVLWISRSARLLLRATYEIPRHVTLAFAPGAVLTLGAGATLDIQGRLDAGAERRFDLAGGRVIFGGPLDEIHAAWWWDGGPGGAAVLRALDVLWERYGRDLDPAPIMLVGPYPLEETLRVVPPDFPQRPLTAPLDVVMRGRHHGLGDPMTFRVSDAKSVGALDALLAVDGKVTFTLENVGLDLTRPAGLPEARSALLLTGEYDRSRVESCAFRLSNGTGVHVTALWDIWREIIVEGLTSGVGSAGFLAPLGAAFTTLLVGAAMQASVTRRASRLVIARCDFEGGGPDCVGVRIDPVAPTMMDVSDCHFRGEYDRGIAFVGSDLMVTHCAFDNEATLQESEPLRAVDIFLGSREALPAAVVNLPGANAQLTATHCVSTSPTFLVGQRVFTSGDHGGAVLTNVLHQPRSSKATDAVNSVRWMAPYASRSLMLQGCELGAPVRVQGATPPGVVVELGTRFAREPHYISDSPDPMVDLSPPR